MLSHVSVARRALVLFLPLAVACSSSQEQATAGTEQNATRTVVTEHRLDCVLRDSTDPTGILSLPLKITDQTEAHGTVFREVLQVGQFSAPIDMPFNSIPGSLKKGESVSPNLSLREETAVGYGDTRAEAWTQVFEATENAFVGLQPTDDILHNSEYSLKLLPFDPFDPNTSGAEVQVTVQLGVGKRTFEVTFAPVNTYKGSCKVTNGAQTK